MLFSQLVCKLTKAYVIRLRRSNFRLTDAATSLFKKLSCEVCYPVQDVLTKSSEALHRDCEERSDRVTHSTVVCSFVAVARRKLSQNALFAQQCSTCNLPMCYSLEVQAAQCYSSLKYLARSWILLAMFLLLRFSES